MAIRSALHQAGAAALTELLQYDPPAPEQRTRPCTCGHLAKYRGLRARPLLTAVGPVTVLRPYFLCGHCDHGQFPVDGALDIENTELSPGVRRMLAVVGNDAPFDHGREQMKLLAGLEVTTKAVERTAEAIGADIAARQQQEIDRARQLDLPIPLGPSIPVLYIEFDGTGVPVVRRETAGRQGKVDGQPAHTREVKLGCVFTQTRLDEKGRPMRDEASTTYTGAIETAEAFSHRIFAEAWQRGWSRAQHKVVLGDGAEWIWNIAQVCFPGTVQIVDLYHARQHLWDLARRLFPGQDVRQKRWLLTLLDHLENGKIERLVSKLRSTPASTPEITKQLSDEADYFHKNANRMRYPAFRRTGLFVGSGVIEAGCKSVIGARLKQSGMFWTVRGANSIIALRCNRLSGRFEDYWEARRSA